MKLLSIKLNNFRFFYCEQKMQFASDATKKITIIHAQNISGKTNFVDAFRWCFYEKIQGEQPEQIVNNLALAEVKKNEKVTAIVSVEFEHEGIKYNFSRSVIVKKIDEHTSSPISTDFKASLTGSDGRNREVSNPTVLINQILPDGMDQYFFLAGENIQEYGKEGAEGKIKEAIKILMGLEILHKGVGHLTGQVKKKLMDDLEAVAAGDGTKLIEEIRKMGEEKNTIETNIKTEEANQKALREIKDKLETQLLKSQKTRELQTKKDGFLAEKKDIEKKLTETCLEIMKKISSEGYLAYAKSIVSKTKDLIDDKRKKGIIPSFLRFGFLQDLLDKHECICDRPLNEGEAPYKVIKSKMVPTSKEEYDDAFASIGNAAAGLLEAHERYPEELRKLCELKSQYNNRIRELDEAIEEITKKYDGKEFEGERELIEKDKKAGAEIKSCSEQLIRLRTQLEDIEKHIDEKGKELEEIKSQNDEYKIRLKRLQKCEEAGRFLKELYGALVYKDRDSLCTKMNNIFSDIIENREDAFVEINNDFEITVKVRTKDGGVKPLPRTGAESQITCVSFILSVIEIAKENLKVAQKGYARGGEFPLVLDSPFGTIDPEFRSNVAKSLPKFCNQLVILVATQQWDNNIEEPLSDFIGLRYYFHRFTEKKTPIIEQRIKGRTYRLVDYKEGRARTEIEKI